MRFQKSSFSPFRAALVVTLGLLANCITVAQEAATETPVQGVFRNTLSETVYVFAWDPTAQDWIPEPYLELTPEKENTLPMFPGNHWGFVSAAGILLGEYTSGSESEQLIDIGILSAAAADPAMSESGAAGEPPLELTGTFRNTRPDTVEVFALDPQTNQWIDLPYLSLPPGAEDSLVMYAGSPWLLMENGVPLGEYIATGDAEQVIDLGAFLTSAPDPVVTMDVSLLAGTFFNGGESPVAVYAFDPSTGNWIEPPYHLLTPGSIAEQPMREGDQWLVMEGDVSLGIYVTTAESTQRIDTAALPPTSPVDSVSGSATPSASPVDPSGKWRWIDSDAFSGVMQINDAGGNVFLNFNGENRFGLRRKGTINIYDSPEGQTGERFTLTITSSSEATLFLPERAEGTRTETLERVPKDPEGDWTRLSDEAPFQIRKTVFGLEVVNELQETEVWISTEDVPDRYLYDHTLVDGTRRDAPGRAGRSLVMITNDDIQVSADGQVVYGLKRGKSPALHIATRRLTGQWTASDGKIYDFDDSDPGQLRMGFSRDNYDQFRVDPADSNRYLYSHSRRNGSRFTDSEKTQLIVILQGSDKAALKRESYQTEPIETYRKGTTRESLIDFTGNWIWDPQGRKNFSPDDEGVRNISIVHSRDGTEQGVTMVMNSFVDWRHERRTPADHEGVIGTRQAFSYNSNNHFFHRLNNSDDFVFNYKGTRENWGLREQSAPPGKEFTRLFFSTRDKGEVLVAGKPTYLLRVSEAELPALAHTAYSIDVNETTWEGFEGSRKSFEIHFLQGGTGLVGFYPFDQNRCFTAFLKYVDSKLVYEEYKQPLKPGQGVTQEMIDQRLNTTIRVDFISEKEGRYIINENGKVRELQLRRKSTGERLSTYLTPDLPYEDWLKEDNIGPSPNTVVQDLRSGEDFAQPPLRGPWGHCITGYSAPFVNPLNLGEEKGTRFNENAYIFEDPSLTRYYYSSPGFEYSIPLMFHATDLSGGGAVSTLQVYATEEDRRKGIGSSMGMNASAPPFKGMNSLSGDFSTSRHRSTQKRISDSEIGFQSMAWGAEHWLTLHKNEIRLHPDFKAYILADSNFIYRDDYKEFFDRYGTHYPISTLFGGYSTVERHVTRREISQSQMRSRSDGGGISAFGVGGNLSISEDTAKTAGTTNENEWVNKFHKGGTGSGEGWSVSPDPSSHVPIKVELRPIYDLIRPEVFGLSADDPVAVTLESRRAEMRMWYHFYMGEIAAINEQIKEDSGVSTSDYPPRYYEIKVAEVRDRNGRQVYAFGAENTALHSDWGNGPELYGHLRLSAQRVVSYSPAREEKVLLANTGAKVDFAASSQDYFMDLWEESRKNMIHEVREISGEIDPIETVASFALEPAQIRKEKSLDGKFRNYPYYNENSVQLYLDYSFHDDDRESAENIAANAWNLWAVVATYSAGDMVLRPDPDDELALQGFSHATVVKTGTGNRVRIGFLGDMLREGGETGTHEIRWAHPTAGEVYLTLKISEVTPQALEIGNPQSLRDLLPPSPVTGRRN